MSERSEILSYVGVNVAKALNETLIKTIAWCYRREDDNSMSWTEADAQRV